MKILITGANGFLGSTVVRHALSSGISIRATDIHDGCSVPGVDYERADIVTGTNPVPKGLDCVIHTAGLAHVFAGAEAQAERFQAVNVTGTTAMMEKAARAGVKHFILVSSVSVYGPFTEGAFDEDVPPRPLGPYAVSKYEAEERARQMADRSGIALTILRLATLYGEGDPGNVERLVRAIDGGHFLWIGSGRNRKSLLYKADAARACLAAATNPASGISTYNVSAPPCTMKEIVDGISEFLGKKPLPVAIPGQFALSLTAMFAKILGSRMGSLHQTIRKWLSDDVYDTTKFEEAFGFRTVTPLKEGLRQEVEWYREVTASESVS